MSKSLDAAKAQIEAGERNVSVLKKTICAIIEAEPLAKIDYVEFVDWNTLEPVETIEGPVLNAMAVYIGKTRLIDNHIYFEDEKER